MTLVTVRQAASRLGIGYSTLKHWIYGLLAQIRLRIGDQTLTAVITRDAVDELKLKRVADALAIVKSTEVMIAREAVAAVHAAAPRKPRARRRR
jgi:molybdopterin-binding protein